ncbi:MAG: GntG family PLP-dependent aldolase [Flavobacteriales bacterium]
MIDLRSDTVTRPGPAMRAAMANAEVGDDVFGEDPTVNSLEGRVAELFGHEAGLFCPSGTMTNQIALHVLTRHGDEVICDEGAHIYRYEGGGLMATSGCSVKLIHGDRGRFKAREVEASINDRSAAWLANSSVVAIENTCNRGGGAVWDLAEVARIKAVCVARGLGFHMDGARIFNALVVTGEQPADWGKHFDTFSVCLSKGLGAPVGSVLVGSRDLIHQARRVRKRLGGGMRQAGLLAAACHYALDHHVERLREDHARALRLGTALQQLPWVASIMPVETNIVIATLNNEQGAAAYLVKLREKGLVAAAFGPNMVRFVLHHDVDDTSMDRAIRIINETPA